MMTNLGITLVDFNKNIYRVISENATVVSYQHQLTQAETNNGKYYIQNVFAQRNPNIM